MIDLSQPYSDPYFTVPDVFPVREEPPRAPQVGDVIVWGGRPNPCTYRILEIEGETICVTPPHWKPPTMDWLQVDWLVEKAVRVRGWMHDTSVRSIAIHYGYGNTQDQWLYADDPRARMMSTLEVQVAAYRNGRNRQGMCAPGAEGDYLEIPPCVCGSWPCQGKKDCPDWNTLSGLPSTRGFVKIEEKKSKPVKRKRSAKVTA